MFNFRGKKTEDNKRVYLDNAAATVVRPEVLSVMDKTARELFANPSAIHKEGVAARHKIEDMRLALARLLKVRPTGVVFTASGTESNNLAIYGLVRQLHDEGRDYSSMTIISTRLEHPSVTEVLNELAGRGVKVEYVDVDEEGKIDLNHLRSLLNESVILVTFAYVNSEIGVVQDVNKIGRLVKKFNTEKNTEIKVHADAAQAPLWLPCQFDGLGVDMLSLDSGKCHGPKGVGVLVMRHGLELKPVTFGGGQESGLRSATENVPGIVGAVTALVEAQENYEERGETVSELRDKTIAELQKIEGLVVNGSLTDRVANNINISIPGVDGEFAVVSLDEKGFAVSTKSACSGAGGGGSKVVETISGDATRANSTIRITLSEYTTSHELKSFVKALASHVEKVHSIKVRLTS